MTILDWLGVLFKIQQDIVKLKQIMYNVRIKTYICVAKTHLQILRITMI